ncbi:hypothetical protein GP486_007723 [Trichoglossum hirsutum]|uniref:Uncharacterized protein n=1 Tax=Trichoglossum hirsutum TaxID=265104 RepID=A0A9P8IF00_9PEZI|nr:hypothetical protein GP486_007723 [Trichoglossum hirsutum]
MFVPRQVQLRTSTVKTKRCLLPALTQPEECQERRPSKRLRLDDKSGPSTTNAAASAAADGARHEIYYEEILCGLELLLSDYAYSEPESKKRFLELERRVEGEGGCMCAFDIWRCTGIDELDVPADGKLPADTHLSAFLDSPVFVRTSPPVTQTALRKALEDCKSELLELIHYLLSHHRAPRSILPVQHVHVGRHPSYAFLVLSAPVSGIEEHCWPIDWVVLTKYHADNEHRAEWKRRDSEYQALRIMESRPSGYSIGNKNAYQLHLATRSSPNRAESQPSLSKQDYPTGLLVYLTNLDPSATKASITTLISRHVDGYSMGLHRAQKQKEWLLLLSRDAFFMSRKMIVVLASMIKRLRTGGVMR